MNLKKWKIGLTVACLLGGLTAGAGLVAGMQWQAFVAVLCTSLATHLGAYLMKHPIESIDLGTTHTPKRTSNGAGPLLSLALSVALLGGLCVAPVALTGCSTPSASPTVTTFTTLRDTQILVDRAMQLYAAGVVTGEVSTQKQAQIDKAHAQYRSAFRLAVTAARNDLTKLSNAELDALASEVIMLITSL